MKKFTKYLARISISYSVLCGVLLVLSGAGNHSSIVVRMMNWGEKPTLWAWISSGETFHHGESLILDGVKVFEDGFFKDDELSSVVDAQYLLFLINGEEDQIPEKLIEALKISKERIAEAHDGKLLSKTVGEFKISIGLSLPLTVGRKTMAFVDTAQLNKNYDQSCHIDIIRDVLFSNRDLAEKYVGCRRALPSGT